MKDSRYVTEHTGDELAGFVTHTVVDMAGNRLRVNIPHRQTTHELAHPVIEAAVRVRRACPER
jgi:hypothetical protein